MNPFYTPLLLLSLAIGAYTQIVGQDVCVCSPGTYEFTLDFSLFCPPTEITALDPGVNDTSCLVSQFGLPGATDLVPASVDRIDVLEIRFDATLILRNEINGPFSDGDVITHTTSPIGSTAGIEDIPFGIQFNTHAFNAAGQPLLNVLSIKYTNECDVYPVIREDQTAGWLRFTRLGPPQDGLCPAAVTGAPTIMTALPTFSPTILVITDSPTTEPEDISPVPAPTVPTPATPSPTISTEAPVPAPTEAPVESPSESPSASPTQAPIVRLTEAPQMSATDAPEPSPTVAPEPSPTVAPEPSPTVAPVPSPTNPPVDQPVPAPTPATTPRPTSATRPTSPSTPMPVQGGMSMSMVMMDIDEMLDMEDKLDAAVDHYEEFGRTNAQPSNKASKRIGSMPNAAPSMSSYSSKKSSKRR